MPWWFNYPGLLLNAEVEYPCLSGERRHLPCINFKDSARPAELPRWLSWYSICLKRRRSWVRVPPEAAPLSLEKEELSSGVVACICFVSITDYSCIIGMNTCIYIGLNACTCMLQHYCISGRYWDEVMTFGLCGFWHCYPYFPLHF